MEGVVIVAAWDVPRKILFTKAKILSFILKWRKKISNQRKCSLRRDNKGGKNVKETGQIVAKDTEALLGGKNKAGLVPNLPQPISTQ